jgi:hypothetical protein
MIEAVTTLNLPGSCLADHEEGVLIAVFVSLDQVGPVEGKE